MGVDLDLRFFSLKIQNTNCTIGKVRALIAEI